MRLVFLILFLLGLAAVGCNKQQQTAAGSVQEAPLAPPSKIDYSTPAEEAAENQQYGGQKGEQLEAAGKESSSRDRVIVQAALDAQLTAQGCVADKEADQISGPLFLRPEKYSETVDRLLGKLQEKGEGISEKTATAVASEFLLEKQQLAAALEEQAELAKNVDASGRGVKPIENQAPPRLDPLENVVGKWQSIREVNEAFTMEVLYNDNYYEVISIRANKTLQWVVYRSGREMSNAEYKYRYDGATGECELYYMNDAPFRTKAADDSGDPLQVLGTNLKPGELFLRTPGMDKLKVFKKVD